MSIVIYIYIDLIGWECSHFRELHDPGLFCRGVCSFCAFVGVLVFLFFWSSCV